MDEKALRTILLIQAVEESDTAGELLPHAERAAATGSVAGADVQAHDAFTAEALSPAGELLLARRAAHLHERLRLRAPVTEELLEVAGGSSASGVLLSCALLAGVLLAALDGRGYIDVLGGALLGLIGWNLAVYALLIANWVRPRAFSGAGLAHLYARWMAGRVAAVLRRSRSFNAPLAAALPRFASEWGALGRALVIQRAKRLMHVCAALVAVGFIIGLFVRAEVLRDHAAWSGRFLAPAVVHVLLQLIYGPAAAISGIMLPAAAQDVEAMLAGVAPLPWLYLIALTATLYIILPRALAAAAASLHLWQGGRRMPLPESVLPYARRALLVPAAPGPGDPR